MNKVITINLGGNAFQLEEGGYDALRAYFEIAEARLAGNPDKDEIFSDIERAIADKFRALLASNKSVVEAREVAAVVAEMGPIEADPSQATADPAPGGASAASGAPGAGAAGKEQAAGRTGAPRRLYRIHEGAMLAGVCNGIGAYMGIDPTVVRLTFVALTLLWGTGLLVYLIMAIVVPEATSPEQKAAASGAPSTAQEFIRRAKEGYYEAMKGFPDKAARREWKRRCKAEMRWRTDQWRYNWHSYWAEHVPFHPSMSFGLPLFSLLYGAVTILWLSASISLLANGTVLGFVLPANVPVWVAVLALLFAYGVLAAPLKLARRACYWGYGRPEWAGSFLFLMDAVVWMAIASVLMWLGVHYFPELREAVQRLPSLWHQAAADVQEWSKAK